MFLMLHASSHVMEKIPTKQKELDAPNKSLDSRAAYFLINHPLGRTHMLVNNITFSM